MWLVNTIYSFSAVTFIFITHLFHASKLQISRNSDISFYFFICFIVAITMPKLVYHRLDLLPTDNACMHLKEYATLGKPYNAPCHFYGLSM